MASRGRADARLRGRQSQRMTRGDPGRTPPYFALRTTLGPLATRGLASPAVLVVPGSGRGYNPRADLATRGSSAGSRDTAPAVQPTAGDPAAPRRDRAAGDEQLT